MGHDSLNFNGLNKIEALENQMLVLLLMSFFIADQFIWHRNNFKKQSIIDFNFTVVIDKLGCYDYERMEKNLRYLIAPEGEEKPIRLTRSAKSDTFSGDLLADNLAGWLNTAMEDPSGEYAQYAKNLEPTGVWNGWHLLIPSTTKLESIPAISKLTTSS